MHLTEVTVMFTQSFVYRARWHHHPFPFPFAFAFAQHWLNHSGLGILGLVCNDGLPRLLLKQHIGALQVMCLPRRKKESLQGCPTH